MSRQWAPETKYAWLTSYGYGPGLPRWTRHKYVKMLECTLPGEEGEIYELVYRCEETGAERRWGTYAPDEISEDELS